MRNQKKQKIKLTALEVVKASRKKSREEEIKTFGKPINYQKIVKSKKVYSRKKSKADDSEINLPC